MPITRKENGNIEFTGLDAFRLAVSRGNNLSFGEKLKLFFGRPVCIHQERVKTDLTGEWNNSFEIERKQPAKKTSLKSRSHHVIDTVKPIGDVPCIAENVLIKNSETKPDSSPSVNGLKPEPDKASPPTQDHRSRFGGKGQFLTVMTKAGLPVPPFRLIEHSMLQAIDDVVIEPQLLANYHPGDISQLQPVTLGSLKKSIPAMDTINQDKWLDALGKLLISDAFLQQVAKLPVARTIRSRHQKLIKSNPNQSVIIRSSGLKEDGFGDSQAGKYESCLHSGGDILKSCLEVLASGYQPALCPDGKPQPMALIMQSYLDCRFGGVAHSHTSLQDDTLQIEYAPGQPRGAVAGTNSLKPHRYQIRRNGTNPIQWSPGGVPSYFVLKKTAEGFTEEKHEGPSAEQLPEGIPEQLKRHIVQLENLLGCPVDVEFAVDQQDRLFLVQVRPITALPGAASFSGPPPDQPLCAGELVSEGLATGEAYYVDKPVADIPKGAIIHAVNAAPWMLEPAIINRAGGYVFKNGGNNDHIAIMLKQSGKPCMRSDAPFTGEKPESPSRVTLLAGNFHQTCGAYLLDGDQTAHWSTRYTKPTLDYAAALTTSAANRPCAPTFTRVEQGFLWLHGQNQRVLNYFLRGRLMDLCLAPGHNKLLSMSAHRAEVLQALKIEVENFLLDAQNLLKGYERFLKLHTSGAVSKNPDMVEQVEHFLKEIKPLKNRLKAVKSQVLDWTKKISDPMITQQELPKKPINYQQWLNDGEALINELQQLNQPQTVDGVQSAHDLVFYIHKQFIAALEPVASQSGQGVVEKIRYSTISNFFSDNSESLLTEPIKEALESAGQFVALNLPTACIANIKLGMHASTIAMFEHGEGGKGRKLQLTLSDDMRSERQGKLKRFWYLAHAIQLRLAGQGVQNMITRFNPATNSLTIELRHMESTEAMKDGFLSLTKLLLAIRNLDKAIDAGNITGHPEMWQWDDTTVEKMITQSQDDPGKNDQTFKYCLLKQGHSVWSDSHADSINSEYSQEHQIFFQAGRSFFDYYSQQKWFSKQELLDGIDRWLTEITAPLGLDSERVKKELSFMLLSAFPTYYGTFYNYVQKQYPEELDDKSILKTISCHNLQLFSQLPPELRNDTTFATDVIMSHEGAFEYAGEQITNDKDIVIAMLQRFPENLRYVNSTLKEDRDVVMAAVNVRGDTLRYAGKSQQANYDVVTAAVANTPRAFQYVNTKIMQDTKFILKMVKQDPSALIYIKPEYQNMKIARAALRGNIKMKNYIRHDIMKKIW